MKLFKKEKKGVASLYVVVFATILFGVITLSFTKIVLSEIDQTSKDDLSQSAYDAALAGIEDARYYVNKYYNCLNTGACSANSYDIFVNMRSPDYKCSTGFKLAEKMGSSMTGEVFVGSSDIGDQAYTCVLVSDVVPDYRGTLSSDTRTKVIPLHVNGSGTTLDGNRSYSKVTSINFGWQAISDLNPSSIRTVSPPAPGSMPYILPTYDNKPTPPALQIAVIKTGENLNIDELHKESNIGSGEVIYSTMVFVPTAMVDSTGSHTVDWNTLVTSGNTSNASGDTTLRHDPVDITCGKEGEFSCNVKFTMSEGTLSDKGNIFLVVSLPYGDAYTDFKVEVRGTVTEGGSTKYDELIDLKGIQVSVDSTGRTNQLYRRVEARLDAADLFFPYPQYAAELGNGGTDDSVTKNFWVTANCWTELGSCPHSTGKVTD